MFKIKPKVRPAVVAVGGAVALTSPPVAMPGAAAAPPPAPKMFKIKPKQMKESAAPAAAPKLKTFKIKPKPRPEPNAEWERPAEWGIPLTLGEEVDQAVAEWYGRRGMAIPAAEIGIGKEIDRVEEQRYQEMLKGMAEAEKREAESPAGEKPEFGTPAFWAWARKRKAEKDKERAAQGLPPLPTAAQKKAAAAEKKAAKAAAASGKSSS